MTALGTPIRAFDSNNAATRSQLDGVVDLEIEQASDDPSSMLVIALRPGAHNARVVSSTGNSAIRAAISVAVAAGTLDSWITTSPGELVEAPVTSLPEIVRSAAIPGGMHTARLAAVGRTGEPACLAIWLLRTPNPDPSTRERALAVVGRLREAAHADARAEAAAAALRPAATEPVRPVGDDLTAIERFLDGTGFGEVLDDCASDETAVVAIGIDDSDALQAKHGADVFDTMRRTQAVRLTKSVRISDSIAAIDESTFAVLLVDVDRVNAFEVVRRLRVMLSEPIDIGESAIEVSMSVGLAHDVGLVDAAELFAAATSALAQARRDGGARMLVAC